MSGLKEVFHCATLPLGPHKSGKVEQIEVELENSQLTFGKNPQNFDFENNPIVLESQ